jgi:hypothetical protein
MSDDEARVRHQFLDMHRKVNEETRRVAALGGWADDAEHLEALYEALPTDPSGTRFMLSLAMACCLDLIPREKQRLAAIMHRGASEEAILQIRKDLRDEGRSVDPDSETAWWLAVLGYCNRESNIYQLLAQIETCKGVSSAAAGRESLAESMLTGMRWSFYVVDGVAFLPGSHSSSTPYFFGHDFVVGFDREEHAFTLSTFRASLGLESFPFSERCDKGGTRLSRSFDSQSAQIGSFEELGDAIMVVRRTLV